MKEICDIYGSGFDNNDQNTPFSVLQAKRIHKGKILVLGTIVSISEMYLLPIKDKENPQNDEYVDAKAIQLEDTEKLDENERLDVTLYNEMTENVIAGEVVEIKGNMEIENKKPGKNIKKINVLHATSIKYVSRKQIAITRNDIKNYHRFSKFPYLIERLVSMFAPNVVGHSTEKQGLLRSIVGGDDLEKNGGGRIHTFLVGDPGTAKSLLTREATEVKLNSRFISAPHASTKTITAMVDKENDSQILRLGAIPLSKGALCGINEITEFSLEDQSRLLDVLEEGKFPVDKYGRHFEVHSPTTIIATANPIQSTWNDSEVISNDEIQLRKTLLDRFTQIYGFRDNLDGKQTEEFVKQMSKIRKRKLHNYNFLRKYLLFASGINVKMTREAQIMLDGFWVKAKNSGLLTIRMYKGLYKIAEAQAKLQLKGEVDEEIAKEAIESIRIMMVQYGPTIGSITGPKETTYKIFLDIIKNAQTGIIIEELCNIACGQNNLINEYLGANWSIENNHKLRAVIDMLSNNSRIQRIGQKPIILKWLPDTSDTSDVSTNIIRSENDSAVEYVDANVMSERSVRSESIRNTAITQESQYCLQYSQVLDACIPLQNCDRKGNVIITAAFNKNNLFYVHNILVKHLSKIESR